MKTKLFKRVLSIFILTMIASNMFLTTPVSAAPYTIPQYNYGNRVKARYTDPLVDIALGKTVTTSSNQSSASLLVDGITNHYSSLWIGGTAGNGEVQTIDIDLGKYYYFDRWVVKNAKDIANGHFIPRAYYLSYIDENGNWVKIDSVVNDVASITDRILARQYIARYLRITFTQGFIQNNIVALTEIGIYNSRGYMPEPGDILTTTSSAGFDHSAICLNYNTAVEGDGMPSDGKANQVTFTTMNKWKTNYTETTVLRVKNATFDMAHGAALYANSKAGYPYNYNVLNYKSTSAFYCNSLVYHSWRCNGVKSVKLDSDVWFPPLTVEDIRDDNDVYVAYERSNGIASSNIVW